jgi:hypothetical protein
LLIVLAGNGFAQSAPPSKPVSVPPIEDRELYYSFFNYHQGLVSSMQAAKAANPQNSAQLDRQMAALLQVDVKELPIVTANTQQVKAGGRPPGGSLRSAKRLAGSGARAIGLDL